ncbi:aminoglycoside phosphotransferase family protein [Paenibacillus sp. M1]|uniref:Aminoglycoside phosphotransferase family protein n=1 Tax=Paenibacillus haidiansis TaxID=1574488 RepID=A0ABU7VNB0_9BACL
MENAIKRHLSQEELKGIVDQAFGGRKELVSAQELTDGWFNSAYTLTLDDGMKTVLKVAPVFAGMMGYERGLMRTEVEVLRLLKGAGGIPVPEVYYYRAGDNGNEWFLMEYVEGIPYNKVKQQLPDGDRWQIEEELGRLSRKINDIHGEKFGYYALEERQGDSWPNVFADMVAGLLDDARDRQVTLPASDEDILSLVAERRASLEEVTVPSLVHWDLWDGNVFVDGAGVTALIDCERALWGDPLMEYNFRSSAGEMAAFRKGYRKANFTEAEKERIELYDLYLALILYIECSYRGYADPNYIRWTEESLKQCWAGVTANRKVE